MSISCRREIHQVQNLSWILIFALAIVFECSVSFGESAPQNQSVDIPAGWIRSRQLLGNEQVILGPMLDGRRPVISINKLPSAKSGGAAKLMPMANRALDERFKSPNIRLVSKTVLPDSSTAPTRFGWKIHYELSGVGQFEKIVYVMCPAFVLHIKGFALASGEAAMTSAFDAILAKVSCDSI